MKGSNMNSDYIMMQLLNDGSSRRMAEEYLEMLEAENKSDMFDPAYRNWAHKNGFLAESACAYGLTSENIDEYLSDYDYTRLWPLNSWQRIWINDKLTLYAMLLETDLQQYLPEYYFYSTEKGWLPLAGSNKTPTAEGLVKILREKGEIAAKPCNGTLACGFHKIEYSSGKFMIDNKKIDEKTLIDKLDSMKNYVFTEFIKPSSQFAQINARIHTIRIIVLNETGIHPELVAGYVRFAVGGNAENFKPNYEPPTRADIFSYNANIDLETGHISNGKIVYASKVIDSPCHPTSKTPVDFVVNDWPEIVDLVKRISMKFSACEYLGFDIGVTDKGPRIMEINSNSGIKYIQLFKPLMADRKTALYFKTHLAEIDELSPQQKKQRNAVRH